MGCIEERFQGQPERHGFAAAKGKEDGREDCLMGRAFNS
jgi:hypothetical protein